MPELDRRIHDVLDCEARPEISPFFAARMAGVVSSVARERHRRRPAGWRIAGFVILAVTIGLVTTLGRGFWTEIGVLALVPVGFGAFLYRSEIGRSIGACVELFLG